MVHNFVKEKFEEINYENFDVLLTINKIVEIPNARSCRTRHYEYSKLIHETMKSKPFVDIKWIEEQDNWEVLPI